MDKTEPKISDSDDARSPSDNEKHVKNELPVDIVDIPDPDEGLSEEERKKIVSTGMSLRLQSNVLTTPGSQIAMETRHPTYTLAGFPLFDLLFGMLIVI
jgi:hypothetical protein